MNFKLYVYSLCCIWTCHKIPGMVDAHLHAKLRNIKEIAAMLNGESKKEGPVSWQ